MIWFVLTAMVVVQGCFAWRDNLLTLKQMLENKIYDGLPFLMHGGMWGDLIWFSTIIAAIVVVHGRSWSWVDVGLAGVIGLAASLGMHEGYKNIPWMEAHVQHHSLTEAGWVHVVYMAVGFAVLLLYYVRAPYATYMWAVSAAIIIHVIVGTHVPLALTRPFWYPGHPLQDMNTWAQIGGVAVLTLGVTTLRYFRIF